MVGKAIAFLWDWTVRILVALLGLFALFWVIPCATSEAWFFAPVLLFIGLYLTVAPFAPDAVASALGWLGRQLSKPYNRFFVRYVAEPVEAGAAATGRLLEGVLILAFKVALWVLGIGIVIFVSWLLFKGVAALPVSVAIIIGAIIIAGALAARRY